MCAFFAFRRSELHIRSGFERFASAKSKKHMGAHVSTIGVFLAFAFRLSETHIRWPEKIGDTFVHVFFVRFALAKRQTSKCVFFFFAFRLSETQKNGDAIVHAFSARFSLGKRAFFEPMLSKT